jgi:hypothetical protein
MIADKHARKCCFSKRFVEIMAGEDSGRKKKKKLGSFLLIL